MPKQPMRGWRTIPGFPNYLVNKNGQVFGLLRGAVLKVKPGRYPSVNLYNEQGGSTKYLHKIVSEVFIGKCPAGYVTDHKDRNTQNYRSYNLRYITRADNSKQHVSCRQETKEFISDKLVMRVYRLRNRGLTIHEASKSVSGLVSPQMVSRIWCGRSWFNVTGHKWEPTYGVGAQRERIPRKL